MKDPCGFTDEYIADYFIRHPEKDCATLNELLEDANSLYGTLLEEIGLKFLMHPYVLICDGVDSYDRDYGSVLGYGNPNESVKIVF